MLVLDRKIGQQVLIGNGMIQMKILRFDKENEIIRLGFNAPSHIEIDREEIYFKKIAQKAENMEDLSA